MSLCRSATASYWAPGTLIMVIGCATVDPTPDYQRADRLIAERTGVEEVYDPEADELIAEKVDRLLSDGLTVEEAVQVALLNNRSFQASFHEIGLSRAEVVRSGLMTNPSLGLSLRFPEGGVIYKCKLLLLTHDNQLYLYKIQWVYFAIIFRIC